LLNRKLSAGTGTEGKGIPVNWFGTTSKKETLDLFEV
jgi:hypothetical protein